MDLLEAGISSEQWARRFTRMAHALPGLGGPEGFNALGIEQERAVWREIERINNEIADALKRG